MYIASEEHLEQLNDVIDEVISLNFGEVKEVIKLNGIKEDGGCYKVKCEKKDIILKESFNRFEYDFYNHIQGNKDINNIPQLYFSKKMESRYWIGMEYIPHQLPKERWYGDEEVIEVIFKLHYNTWNEEKLNVDMYNPAWNEVLNFKTLELFNGADRKEVKNKISYLYEDGQELFEKKCWINGDTNPTNWGVKEDGRVILFDWERISAGAPAIDLAITMPGLGTLDETLEEKIAIHYIKLWNYRNRRFYLSQKELVKQIKLAKVWSAMEFLDNSRELLKEKDRETLVQILRNHIIHY